MPSHHQESTAPGGLRTPGATFKVAQDGVALTGHLFDLETRLASIALREMLQRQRDFATLAGALFRLYSWPFVQSGHTLEMQEIGRRSFELALSAQTTFAQAMVGNLVPRGSPPSDQPVSGRRVQPERRVSGLIINFPERRTVSP